MTKWKYFSQPQRSNGVSYIDCDLARATSFAVLKTRKAKIKGREYTYRNFVSRHQTLNQAENEVRSQMLTQAGPLRRYVIGKRMEEKRV